MVAIPMLLMGHGDYSQAQDGNGTQMDSILLKDWDGPFGGVPPWKQVKVPEFSAAFDKAIEMATAEINSIANNPEPPTFENTFIALENAGRALNRLQSIFGVYQSNLNLGEVPDIERAVAPKLSKYGDSITQNEKLFKRIEAIYNSDAKNSMSVAQQLSLIHI